jgi:hypothetical protein
LLQVPWSADFEERDLFSSSPSHLASKNTLKKRGIPKIRREGRRQASIPGL